jgi:hypothetical protein
MIYSPIVLWVKGFVHLTPRVATLQLLIKQIVIPAQFDYGLVVNDELMQ